MFSKGERAFLRKLDESKLFQLALLGAKQDEVSLKLLEQCLDAENRKLPEHDRWKIASYTTDAECEWETFVVRPTGCQDSFTTNEQVVFESVDGKRAVFEYEVECDFSVCGSFNRDTRDSRHSMHVFENQATGDAQLDCSDVDALVVLESRLRKYDRGYAHNQSLKKADFEELLCRWMTPTAKARWDGNNTLVDLCDYSLSRKSEGLCALEKLLGSDWRSK